ncbi:MAG: hypothetical protein WAQ27_04485 [Candidatus Microsaccharimonas sp.]
MATRNNNFIQQSLEIAKQFTKSDFGIALIITLIWKIILVTIGYSIDSTHGGAASILDHTIRWDAGWYQIVIADHYQTNLASAAFYPLFPILVSAIHVISLGLFDIPLSGQIINTAAVWFALAALLKLGHILLPTEKKYWLVILLLSAPAAFFLHVFYGEAIFIALSFWAYLFALKRQWLIMALLLGLLTASRLPALLIIGLCGLEYLRSYHWKIKDAFNKNVLYFLFVPLGFIAYALYLFLAHHNALAMFSAYKATSDWSYQIFNPNVIETIGKSAYQIVRLANSTRPFDNDLIVNNLFPLASILLLGLTSLYLTFKQKGKYLPLGVTGLISIIMFTLNSNVVSVHRYVLPCLAIYVALALLIKGRFKILLLILCCGIGIAAQMYLYFLFINTIFAG